MHCNEVLSLASRSMKMLAIRDKFICFILIVADISVKCEWIFSKMKYTAHLSKFRQCECNPTEN